MDVAGEVVTTEIVAVDSMQVYRGMDIGTAKPTAADRRRVVHHGIDLVEPGDDWTVTRFQGAYDGALAEIERGGGRALVVAGTGLYLTAVLDRIAPPGRWPDIAAQLEAEADTAALHRRLVDVDPDAAMKIDTANRRRIVRALEVTIGSGRPFSTHGPGIGAFPATDVAQVGIRWVRDRLAERIERRVAAMMDAGLLDEVRRVGPALSPTAAQALGYRELIGHLSGIGSLDDAVAAIVRRTRQFAVRQERWFRRDPRIRWIDVDADDADPLHEVRSVLIDELRK